MTNRSAAIAAASLALLMSGCVSQTRPPVGPAPGPVAKQIVNDGAGGLILPDGTRVTPDRTGGFTLPNGAYVNRDAAGALNLPNGARCQPNRQGGYLCP